MNPTPRVALIGAGIAGLSCASQVQQAGLEVSLFDKSRGAGGRMSTRRGEDWQCDHGAQYFTARHPDFRAEVARWQQAGVAALWAPRLWLFDGDSPAGRESTVERFVGMPAMTAPARHLASKLRLHAPASIRQLKRQLQGWQVFSAEHGWLETRFAAVLLAVPAPQAAALLQQPAPELAALAGSAVMRGCWALMLRFAAPVDLPFDAAFVNQGPLRWIARNSSKPGRSGEESWLLHACAEWSEAHLEDDSAGVAAALLCAFGQLGGPAPQEWTAHRWRYADTEPPLAEGCAWRPEIGLGLCGDWLNGGKVEGAWRSGRMLAEQVLRSLARC
ncbi:MAG TPA: NAD(P)-binding protein [Candidatus Accumulibacter phosphatis]|nr:MAG: protoporphyrinogen oxidase [Candidatus Accumulibacter sp. SK-11]HAY29085.1 NAD/FAD-dependent oxidoreductase [Accumulibacter sp.]HRL77561.1 NAD(P)-binding protein [Candidatus Accumulibacter phosphatis]HCN69179.1 NAD/FAD-dependent oxidoreductase [Accumulibacter sp.]HCV12657.1 NAD/FAD-dependent oxidoreductase [Accumulibacter sp.]